jgi:hypothetical protein
MGFHKRFISNKQVLEIYLDKGQQGVIDWYTKGVDSLSLEVGLASDVGDIINNFKQSYFSEDALNKAIANKINKFNN